MQLDAARNMGVREASQLPPREPFEEPGRRRAALGLILGQIIRSEGLQPDRQRVEERLEELASNYPNPEEARTAYRRSAEAMRQIESAALEEQVIDWFVARAAVREQPMTFQELTGFGQAG